MKKYSKREYLMSFTQMSEGENTFNIANYIVPFDELVLDNGYDWTYYPLGKLDEILDLKVGESIYIEPDYGHYVGKGIILRIK